MKRINFLLSLSLISIIVLSCSPKARIHNLASKNISEATYSDAKWNSINVNDYSGYEIIENGTHDLFVIFSDGSSKTYSGFSFSATGIFGRPKVHFDITDDFVNIFSED